MGAARYGLILTAIDLQKLEIFGSEYIRQHFQRASDEEIYRNYLASAVKALAENTSRAYGGYTMPHSYAELIDAKYDNGKGEPDETPEQVVNGLMERLKNMK